MKKNSFKNWILAGALSGLTFYLIVLLIYCLSDFSEGGWKYVIEGVILYLRGGLLTYIIIGSLIGLILSFLKSRSLLKSVLVAMGINLLGSIFIPVIVVSVFLGFWYVIEGAPLLYSPLGSVFELLGAICDRFGIFSKSLVPLILLISADVISGVIFGVLINYFISRMERKASK